MKCNIGSFDRVLRRSIGLVIMGLGIFYKSWAGLFGILPFVLSYINYCPLYLPFNINTLKGEINDDRNYK